MAPPATPPTTAPIAAPSHPPAIAPIPAPTAAPPPAPIAVRSPGVAHPSRAATTNATIRKCRIGPLLCALAHSRSMPALVRSRTTARRPVAASPPIVIRNDRLRIEDRPIAFGAFVRPGRSEPGEVTLGCGTVVLGIDVTRVSEEPRPDECHDRQPAQEAPEFAVRELLGSRPFVQPQLGAPAVGAREEVTVRSLQIREKGSLVVAEQRDDAAARRRGLRAQLIEPEDHADAVAPPVDVIAQGDQQLSRLCAVPDDAVFALARDEIRNHEELIELFQPPMDVADRPERVEICAKLLGGERHPGRGRRERTGSLRPRL